jgi:hypothetical protein
MDRLSWQVHELREERENTMARIIVTPDEQSDVVLFDEHIYPVHLDNKLSSLQVAERLAWAVSDAEATERRSQLGRSYPEQIVNA